MTLAEDVKLEDIITGKDELSGADIKVIFCVPHFFQTICLFSSGHVYRIWFIGSSRKTYEGDT